MAINGYIINQIAKKVNTTGELYPKEIEELKKMVEKLWEILRNFSIEIE
ncbi:plasmid mobilization relaxosome protein MobC [Floccifex porci]